MSIDWDKPVQTRGGSDVEIHTRGGRSKACPVVGEYRDACGAWLCRRWTHDGHYLDTRESEGDLINVPQQHTVWVNIAKLADGGFSCFIHDSSDEADEMATNLLHRIACIEVTFTEGEGLE